MKKTLATHSIEEFCTVSQMARKLKLSRARFYQLLQQGVFPPPVYCIRTRRPLYPSILQEQCRAIRRNGIDRRGWLVLFYNPRKHRLSKPLKSPKNRYQELTITLQKMGLTVTCRQIDQAIRILYPDGLPDDKDPGLLVRDLFRHFQ